MRQSVLFFLLLHVGCLSAEEMKGRVVKVADGDTITILDADNAQHKIRLSGIDAPERKQAFGERSRQSLAALVAGKQVVIDWNKRDRYQRIIGKVMLNGSDVNLQQIRDGMAWHYKQYINEQDLEDRSLYAQVEYLAHEQKLGLWLDKGPIPPWEFRKKAKNRSF